MTRINSNITSLLAQNVLGRSNAALEQALTRLSTGLRINTGKDDPAGLIASENLRSDITSIQRAIGNTDRANQVIAVADSALGQVSSLLNDIRGLVTESANTGALSLEQVAANQLQVDSSLEALNRIAQTTTFQGRKLLDGSLSFLTEDVQNLSELADLQIEQANLGSGNSLSVEIDVISAAQKASIGTTIDVTSVGSIATLDADLSTVDPGVQSTTGAIDLASDPGDGVGSGTIEVRAVTAGTTYDGAQVLLIEDTNLAANSVQVTFDGTDILIRGNGTVDETDLQAAFAFLADFEIVTPGAVSLDFSDSDIGDGSSPTLAGTLANGRAPAGTLTIETVENTDEYNGVVTQIRGDNSLIGTGIAVVAEFDGTTLLFRVNTDPGLGSLIDASDFQDALEAAELDTIFAINGLTSDLDGTVVSTTATTIGNIGDTTEGADDVTGLLQEVVFELSGRDGSESFSFQAGTTGDVIAAAINLVKDATGVEAEFDDLTGDLTLTSTAFGSRAFVDVNVLSEGSGGTFKSGFGGTLRDAGDDVNLTVNGVKAKADGFSFSVNTATLDLAGTLNETSSATDIDFNIVGGGALFQLGPDVVSNQQARIGITSVNTARLGGVSGKLFQLGSGGSADLSTSPTKAARIVEEAINQVTSLRGRLGAFQRTTLETNRNALNDTLVNLSEAESLIRDADFAAETAALTRAQILVQTGTTVLQIANSNPQNVLALLR